MEVRSTEDAKKNVEDFSKRLIQLMMDKKEIDLDIKALKNEFKEEGVPVSIVSRMIGKLKMLKKKSESEIFEENTIQDWLSSNVEIDDKIGSLNDS